jgi:peptidoglycan/xylan/chitin deacetylase (PgdA/CDA1 family)
VRFGYGGSTDSPLAGCWNRTNHDGQDSLASDARRMVPPERSGRAALRDFRPWHTGGQGFSLESAGPAQFFEVTDMRADLHATRAFALVASVTTLLAGMTQLVDASAGLAPAAGANPASIATNSTATISIGANSIGTVTASSPVASRPIVVRGRVWHVRDSLTSGAATTTFGYGIPGDFPVAGDWDGNGTNTPGIVREQVWHLRNSNSAGPADISFGYGVPGDAPVVGDWDGNGTYTPGVVRGRVWHLRNSNNGGAANVSFGYGVASDIVIAGDWDGNGTTTPGVVRGTTWHLRNSNSAGPGNISFGYGVFGDRPVVGDWDGNGTYTPGVVRGRTWLLRNSNSAGPADVSFTYGSPCDIALSTSSALIRDRGGKPLRAAFTGNETSLLPTTNRVVALTFDAGANADGVPKILSTLESACVPATFFLTGAWIRNFPQSTRMIGLRYPVGNHSDTHPDLTTLSDAAVRNEVLRAQAAIQAGAKYDSRPMFRFPFGARDARTIGIVNDLGYTSIRWTVDTLGWQGTSGGRSVQSVVQRVLDNLQPGEIVLMHVGSHPQDRSTLDADALPTIISEIRNRGYSFVTVMQFM